MHQYLAGELPYFDRNTYQYAHEAVLDDVVLKADSADIPLPVREIIEHMLLADPKRRISSKEAYYLLTAYYEKTWPVARPLLYGANKTGESAPLAPAAPDETARAAYNSQKLRMSNDFFKKAGEL